MGEDITRQITELLESPDKLRMKKPFTRGADRSYGPNMSQQTAEIGQAIQAQLPRYKERIIPQEQYKRELDPACHDVLFDDNLPALCVKVSDGGYHEINFERISIPFQRCIKNKQLMHLTGNPMDFTLLHTEPTETQQRNFITFKQYWELRNQDGMKTKMVDTQLSYGDAGLLYYFDNEGHIKSRILSFNDGYVLCPHNDQNGDRILESVYYIKDGVEYIDSYDAHFMYRWTNDNNAENVEEIGWRWHEPKLHGFEEIPLITKRGAVAWEGVQNNCTSYEILYNVFLAIQRRHGWGILYIKGKFKDQAQKINGSVILNDTSIDGNGDAKFLTAPSPDGTIDTLKSIFKNIQIGASTTFILPEDISFSGDISGVAVQLTLSQDNELARQRVIDWQNVADKMVRLFKYGLSKELVNSGENKNAITEFADLKINAKFKVWRPFSEAEYNQMLSTLVGAGILSKESGIELNTVSKPDEKARISKEEEENERKALELQKAQSVLVTTSTSSDGNQKDNKVNN